VGWTGVDPGAEEPDVCAGGESLKSNMKINRIARLVQHNALARHALFLAAALLSILLVGYHFGTFDQIVHLPFLKATADPGLFPNDAFVAMRREQLSYFWLFFLPLYRAGALEISLFMGQFLATYLTFWALWELSMTLFQDPLAAGVTVIGFIVPHVGFVGFPVIEFSLLSRTFVLPFLLLAVNLYLRRQYGLAFLVMGLMYNLNLLMTNFMVAMLLFASLIEWRRTGWRGLLTQIGAFLLAASPVLLWKFTQGDHLDWSLRPEWLSAFTRGTIYTIFYLFSFNPPSILLTLGGICALILFGIARKTIPSSLHQQTLTRMMLAAVMILLVETVTTLWLPVTWIVQLQISRVGLFVLIFGYMAYAGAIVRLWQTGSLPGSNALLLVGSLGAGLTPLFPMAGWLTARRLKQVRWKMALAGVGLCLSASAIFGMVTPFWSPGIHIYAESTPWIDVQQWAREHTPKEAVFLTPPQNFGIYTPDWRVYSERATVVELGELLEVALKPEYYETWKARFNTLLPGLLERFAGNLFENQAMTGQAYHHLSAAALLQTACAYRADYLVFDQAYRQNFPVLYENEGYRIYDLRQQKVCH
jgi:hypothetical protein